MPSQQSPLQRFEPYNSRIPETTAEDVVANASALSNSTHKSINNAGCWRLIAFSIGSRANNNTYLCATAFYRLRPQLVLVQDSQIFRRVLGGCELVRHRCGCCVID